ncbi:hypothetical protein [Arcicella lustrica]|uniref:Outer membrane protein beta-barrel domain-containing protein n=1 Tax=Arcicella lustrica TaxID=2984196 RepID=A0ABU5SJ14_9BACT|nr:hypothetical protein [Arcicella sp. DC25W]MEA5427288.1 hypothetical protein [Arcicella sp. DC25W]
MKKIILISIFCWLSSLNLFSQSLIDKRIYSGNLSLSLNHDTYKYKFSSPYSATNTNVSISFLAGKIRKNNSYVAYGFVLGGHSLNQVTSFSQQISLGPAVQVGKFIKIFDQFYFAPKSNFTLAGVIGKTESSEILNNKGINTSIDFSPLSFVYQIKDKIMLNMSLGQFALNYTYLNSSNDFFSQNSHSLDINGNLSNYTSLGMFYLF